MKAYTYVKYTLIIQSQLTVPWNLFNDSRPLIFNLLETIHFYGMSNFNKAKEKKSVEDKRGERRKRIR